MPDLPNSNVLQLGAGKRLPPNGPAGRGDASKEPDPIFALIKLQEAAAAAHEIAVGAHSHAEETEDKKSLAAAVKFLAFAQDFKASTTKRLCLTKPKTLAGVAALAECIGNNYECEYSDRRTQRIFETLAAACRDLGG